MYLVFRDCISRLSKLNVSLKNTIVYLRMQFILNMPVFTTQIIYFTSSLKKKCNCDLNNILH